MSPHESVEEERSAADRISVAVAESGVVGAGGGRGAAEEETVLRATAEMCRHCFDLIIDELSPTETSSSRERRRLRKFGGSGSGSASIDAPCGGSNGSGSGDRAIGRRRPAFATSIPPTARCPLFVTWDKRRRPRPSSALSKFVSPGGGNQQRQQQQHEFDLRGCIGTLSPRPLIDAIGEYALTSAFRDRRFDPIGRNEVPELRVAVSLLVNYEDCDHCYDWIVGTHGIIVKFVHGRSCYSATYLPEVAHEQGWSQQEAIRSLIRKSGFRGDICDDLLRRIECTRYQSSKHRLTFDDYVRSTSSSHRNGVTNPIESSSADGRAEERRRPPPPQQPPKQRSAWTQCFNL